MSYSQAYFYYKEKAFDGQLIYNSKGKIGKTETRQQGALHGQQKRQLDWHGNVQELITKLTNAAKKDYLPLFDDTLDDVLMTES